MAANKGLGQVKYSAKYSAVTKALLENWLEYTNNKINNTTYWENYRKITAELGSVKIVVGMTAINCDSWSDNLNLAVKRSFKYDVLFKDQSTFNLADRIGVAFVITSNGTVYQRSACST